MHCRIVLLLLILGCYGCSAVLSVQPLSDDSSSVLDERLYGRWQDPEKPDRSDTITIRHKRGTKGTLEIISERKNRRGVERTIAFALRGKFDLLSARLELKEDANRVVYGICRYRFPRPDTLELYRLDAQIFGRAVEDGTLRGEVTYSERDPGPADDPPRRLGVVEREIDDVTLTDEPERILEFIRRHGDKAFHSEPGVLRRVGSQGGQR